MGGRLGREGYCGTIRRKKSNIYRFLGGENVSRRDDRSFERGRKRSAAMLFGLQLGSRKRGRIRIGQLTLRILGIFMKGRLQTFFPPFP